MVKVKIETESFKRYGEQFKLFETDIDQSERIVESGESRFGDPSFAGNKSQPIHRWVPWIAGFSSDFVRNALRKYSDCKGLILDPFCGVGTTLVEGALQGHSVIGFEINPYAAHASITKVDAHRISVDELRKLISEFETFYKDRVASDYLPQHLPPKGFKTRTEFYSPGVLRKVLIFHDFISSINDPSLRDLFRLAFASTMVLYSNYSYEPSLGRRVSAGKSEIIDFPVGRTISDKLHEMAKDIAWFKGALQTRIFDARVYCESFFNYRNCLSCTSVDIIITSPPYLNNYHYNRNTRPQQYWLGYATHPRDLRKLEHANFGKYWQTVRDQNRLCLNFSLPGSDLEERIETLRSLNTEKGIYGGNGWANYASAYFNDCHLFAQAIKWVLKPGATALIVIGNSILQGIMIPTDVYFAEIAQSIGLELVGIDVPRTARIGNSIIQSDVRVAKAEPSQQLYESIVELKKR